MLRVIAPFPLRLLWELVIQLFRDLRSQRKKLPLASLQVDALSFELLVDGISVDILLRPKVVRDRLARF